MANNSSSAFGTGESWIGRGSAALLRGLGTIGVSAVGLAGIGLTSTGGLLFSQVMAQWPGGSLAAALGVSFVLCLVLAYTFTVIAAAVPRAGADYVLASRVLNAPVAFVASWVFVLFSGLLGGTLVGLFVKEIVPLFSQIAVMMYGSNASQDLIRVVAQTPTVISTGTVIVLVAFMGLFVPQRVLQRILMVGVGLGLAAWVGILASFSALPAGTFEALWNQTHGTGNSFAAVIPAAQALGFMNSPTADFSMVGLAFGLWLFFGFISTTQLGGEVRKPENSILGGSVLALTVSAAVFVAAVVVMERAIPAEWMAAQSFLNQNPAYVGESTSYITYYTWLVFPSLPLLLLVFWGWVLSFVVLVQAYITFMGRVMLAWADDGLLPEGMAYVHPRFRSPLVTLLLAAILVQLGLVAFFATTPSSLQARFSFFSSAVLLVPVIAVTFFPFLKKDWFQASPAFVQRKIGPLPLVTLTGFISMVYLLFLLVRPLLTPGDSASISIGDLLVLGVMVLSGIFWYMGRRMHRHAHGVHLEEVLRNLPRGS